MCSVTCRKKGSLAGGGNSVGVARGDKGKRGKKGSDAGNGVPVGVSTVGSICQHVDDADVPATHQRLDLGMRPPRHIINGVEVYGWEEQKMNEPYRVDDVPPLAQENRQTEESSSSLIQRTANVLKRCVVS